MSRGVAAAERIEISQPSPRIVRAQAAGVSSITVGWSPARAGHAAEVVDLMPVIGAFKFYAPLLNDPGLFAAVSVDETGRVLSWGEGSIDMAASTVRRLAEEQMSNADFVRFLAQTGLTYDAAAAVLGLSRRQIAYFAATKPVPRVVALACRTIAAQRSKAGGGMGA